MNDIFKIEAAKELGLIDKVKKKGWAGLSAEETGRIGAMVKKKLKDYKIENFKKL
ncbi:MAG: small, acid-soluble spore protein, alpha/beta type [Thermoanaerobacteraceae bacterium]